MIGRASLAVLVLTATVYAQSSKAADKEFERGLALMDAKSYAEACAAFELSQSLDPQYGTQFNLAGCYVELKKLATAWELYRVLAKSDTNAARRAESVAREKQLAARVPKLRVLVEQNFSGLVVKVGDRDISTLLGVAIPFDAGSYDLVASVAGYQPFHQRIEIAQEGQVVTIPITLVAEGHADTPPPPPASHRALYGKILTVSGAGLVAFGLVAGQRALSNRDRSRDLCNAMDCPDHDASQDAVDRARVWAGVSTATVITGLVAVAGGIYLWRTSRSTTATVALAPSGMSFVVSARF